MPPCMHSRRQEILLFFTPLHHRLLFKSIPLQIEWATAEHSNEWKNFNERIRSDWKCIEGANGWNDELHENVYTQDASLACLQLTCCLHWNFVVGKSKKRRFFYSMRECAAAGVFSLDQTRIWYVYRCTETDSIHIGLNSFEFVRDATGGNAFKSNSTSRQAIDSMSNNRLRRKYCA